VGTSGAEIGAAFGGNKVRSSLAVAMLLELKQSVSCAEYRMVGIANTFMAMSIFSLDFLLSQ
jgi:hypothetical protein